MWEGYAEAYRERYGETPVRNAKVNGQLAQFIQRVPRDEAPAIAAFYVGSYAQRYVAAGHPVGMLLQDAEALRTEWVTGRRRTTTAARQSDRRQSLAEAGAKLIERYEREDGNATS